MNKRRVRTLQFALLSLLAGGAVYLWAAPKRQALTLETASLEELQKAAKQHPSDPHAFYYLAQRWEQLGDLPHADEALEHAAGLTDNDARIWLTWATLRSRLHRDNDAHRILAAYIQKRPDSAAAHLALAWIADRAQASQEAFDEARKAALIAPEKAEAWRLMGSHAEAMKHFDEAEQALQQAVRAEPLNGGCRFDQGDFLMRRNRYVEAAASYQEAARLLPNDSRTSLALGQTLLLSAQTPAQLSAARASLQTSARLQPNDLRTWVAIGETYVREAKWREALTALRHRDTLPTAPPNVRLQCAYLLARVYTGLSDTTGAAREKRLHGQVLAQMNAIVNMEHRILASPNDTSARLQMARLCAAAADYAASDAVYRKLLTLAPDSAAARQELAALEQRHPEAGRQFAGTALARTAPAAPLSPAVLLQDADNLRAQKRYKEAKTVYARVLQSDKNSAPACLGLGLTLEALGDREGAFTCVYRATTLDPQLLEAQRRLADYYRKGGFRNQARLQLERVVKIAPQDAENWHTLGLICNGSHVFAGEALDALQRTVTLAPSNAAYQLDLADALLDSDHAGEAETLYRHALTIAPNNEEVLSRVGGYLASAPTASAQQKARQTEGENFLRHALALNPANGFTLYSLGHLAMQRGDYRQAIHWLEAASTQEPDTSEIWFELAAACRRNGDPRRAGRAQARYARIQNDFHVYSRLASQVSGSPQNADLRLRFARLCAQRGENAQALNQYQVCLHLEPKNEAARRECASLTSRLQAAGQMPAMGLYNAMAATLSHSSG